MAVKGKREGRRKHRATAIKLATRHVLARKFTQNKINKDQLEREAGPALEGVMKMVAQMQEQAGKRRGPVAHPAPGTPSPAVQQALTAMDARMAAREAARLRRIQEQRKPPPPPPKSKKRFQRGGPRPSGPRPEGMGEGRPAFGPRPEGAPRPIAPAVPGAPAAAPTAATQPAGEPRA